MEKGGLMADGWGGGIGLDVTLNFLSFIPFFPISFQLKIHHAYYMYVLMYDMYSVHTEYNRVINAYCKYIHTEFISP